MTARSDKPVRHILALSVGKDSSALAVFMTQKSSRGSTIWPHPSSRSL